MILPTQVSCSCSLFGSFGRKASSDQKKIRVVLEEGFVTSSMLSASLRRMCDPPYVIMCRTVPTPGVLFPSCQMNLLQASESTTSLQRSKLNRYMFSASMFSRGKVLVDQV